MSEHSALMTRYSDDGPCPFSGSISRLHPIAATAIASNEIRYFFIVLLFYGWIKFEFEVVDLAVGFAKDTFANHVHAIADRRLVTAQL